MKKISVIFASLALLLLAEVACTRSSTGGTKAQTPPPVNSSNKRENNDILQLTQEATTLMKELNLNPGDKLYADFETSMGNIKAELFWDKAPMTVLNFVELAQGKKEWTNPKTQEKVKSPLYDNTIFHRVIKDFMIQGGDPMGTGFGGPGFKFKDEFNAELRHSAKGILSMANAGPNTNGSQFFITEAPTPHLDNRHSVFGQVKDAASLELIGKIGSVKTLPGDKPEVDVVLKTIKISKS